MILYVKTGCPWCRLAEAYLDERGYKYQRLTLAGILRHFRNLNESLASPTRQRLLLKICSWPISDPMNLKIF